MNKKQADDIINLIQTNINIKKQNVEKIYNQDVATTPDFASKNVENEFSMLGKMHKTLSGEENVQRAIKFYVKSKKYDDSNIGEIAKQYKSKVKSVKKFESELTKLLNNKGLIKKFNRFLYVAYVDVERILNHSNMDATPASLLKLMNDNRNEIGLDSVTKYNGKKAILSSYVISSSVECSKDVKLNKLVDDVNNFAKKFGHEIQISNPNASFLPIVNELYQIILDNYTEGNTFDDIASSNKDDIDISLALQKFNQMPLPQKNEIRKSVTEVATLLLTNRVLALTVEDKLDYIQISKVIRYDICNQLCNLVDKFNNCSVTYALAKIVENDFEDICSKLNLSAEDCQKLLNIKGIMISSDDMSLSALALDEQTEEINNVQKDLKKTFEMNFDKIQKEDYYVAVVNAYIERFNKLFSEKKFVPNAKIDLSAENLKIKSISIDAKNLISMIESKNYATEEQFKVFIDAHAYGVVSNSVLRGLAKQYFNFDVDSASEVQVVEAQPKVAINSEPAKHLLPNIVYNQELIPTVRKYEPNFIIINDNSVSTKAENADESKKQAVDVIDAEFVEHKQENKNVVENEKTHAETPKPQENTREVEKTVSKEPAKQETKVENVGQKGIASTTIKKTKNENTSKKAVQNKPKAQQEKTKKENKTSVQKGGTMDEETKKLNEQNEEQRREIEELKKQLARAKMQTAKPVANNISVDKVALSGKIENILTNSFKSSIKNLANLDFDLNSSELNNSILHTNMLSSSARKLMISLNTYISLSKAENEQIKKNSFVSGNTESTVKDIMKFEFYLKKLIKNFADKIADSIESEDKPVEVLILDTIEKYCHKYVAVMEQNKKEEVKKLQEKYGDDEYELDSRLDLLNDKYYGSDGLINSLKANYLSLLTKDIIISQIKEIDYAEAKGQNYVFDKQKVNQILDEITGKAEMVEEQTF